MCGTVSLFTLTCKNLQNKQIFFEFTNFVKPGSTTMTKMYFANLDCILTLFCSLLTQTEIVLWPKAWKGKNNEAHLSLNVRSGTTCCTSCYTCTVIATTLSFGVSVQEILAFSFITRGARQKHFLCGHPSSSTWLKITCCPAPDHMWNSLRVVLEKLKLKCPCLWL